MVALGGEVADLCTGTSRSSWATICSSTCGLAEVTMVIRLTCLSSVISLTVRLSIL